MYKALFLLLFYLVSINILLAAYSVKVISLDAVNSTGVVEVTADGRTGPYVASINLDLANIQAGSTTAIFNDIAYGDHVAYVDNAHGCRVELPFRISDCPLEVHFFLEGAFNGDLEQDFTGESNVMNHQLFDRGLLPGQTPISNLATATDPGQPYNQAPWAYTGTEGATWTDVDYMNNFPNAEPVDWALLTLINNVSSNHNKLFQAAGVVDINGEFHFTCPSDLRETIGASVDFYARIEHRNHMGILSSEPFNFNDDGLFAIFDFRTADSYRDPTSVGQVPLKTTLGYWGMFGGDANQSDFPSYDINGLDKAEWSDSNGVFDNYLPGDMNLDGDVNGKDKIVWEGNNGYSSRVPRN